MTTWHGRELTQTELTQTELAWTPIERHRSRKVETTDTHASVQLLAVGTGPVRVCITIRSLS